jgi:hypothetical protein
VVKKLEKGKTAPKIDSQPSKKQVQDEKDKKVEYARSVFLNARRPHIKNGIGYKNGDKHNSRVTLKVKNSSSSLRPMSNKRRSKVSRPLTMFVILILMLLMFLMCHTMISMLLMCLWEISLEKLLLYMSGHITRGQRLVYGCPSVLSLT